MIRRPFCLSDEGDDAKCLAERGKHWPVLVIVFNSSMDEKRDVVAEIKVAGFCASLLPGWGVLHQWYILRNLSSDWRHTDIVRVTLLNNKWHAKTANAIC